MSNRKGSYILILSIILSFPNTAFSAVEISLINGRTITADRCNDTGENLLCEKMGGVFTIPKREITRMKEVEKALPYRPERLSGTPEETSAPVQDDEREGMPESASEPLPSDAEETVVIIPGKNPEAEKRLHQIAEKKKELQKERGELIKAQEQLIEEVNKKGLITSQEEFDATNKRITGLGESIKKFNEQVKALNEEEKTILKSVAEQP